MDTVEVEGERKESGYSRSRGGEEREWIQENSKDTNCSCFGEHLEFSEWTKLKIQNYNMSDLSLENSHPPKFCKSIFLTFRSSD